MGGFGAPDRGGSREGKKSLRGNKQAIQKLVKDEQKGHVKAVPRPTVSEKPPPAVPPAEGEVALVDAAAQLASRQFDRDQFKVLQRAASSGVGPIITYTTDDSKLEALVRTAKENAGQVYCMVGVHSDNIKRANDRLSPTRLEQLKDLALEAGCVAVLAGLAFRDVGIRYAQERALSEQMALAAGVGLPLVLYEVRASEALVERITEFRSSGAGEGRAAVVPIAIFNFAGSGEELAAYLALGCYIILTGRVCDSTERGEQLRELATAIPRHRLILASDSPFTTPQNIPDVFMREGRNEPSNLPYVLGALAPALGLSAAELAASTRRNTLLFFGIQEAAEAAAAAAAEAAEATAATVTATAATVAAPCAGGQAAAAIDPEMIPSPPPLHQHQHQHQHQHHAPPVSAQRTVKAEGLSPVGAGRKGPSLELVGEEEDDEDGDERGSGGASSSARAANLFALMQLREDGNCDGDGEGAKVEEEAEDADGDDGAERTGGGASTSFKSGDGAVAAAKRGGTRGGKAGPQSQPRNFVAEYAAAAAAKGPVTGPRVSYSCRGCRSILFTEADAEGHRDEERALFAASKPRKKGRGRQGNDLEASLCSMHFLRKSLPWMEMCLQTEGPQVGEGKLVCPTCAAKLGKWAAGPGATGVQCSCGVVVPAPAYAVLRARLDILDAQLDIASAVQSSLKAYAEEEGAMGGSSSSSSSSGDEGSGTRKKRPKQRRNKTANFSSFRNKNFGFSLKQQRQLAESVTAGTAEGISGANGAGGLGAVREESD
ncbi:hypothetical protein VaNZ11_013208 [Volvox africanus]|uniref:TatD related DNase n=1 Tax=Volvox africanus TaxID=51714 RepID=A0ABQ5SFW6_9CHLO|nr:hypothetical protein VaNZ11_013208 [Volvox africanus]